MLLLIDPFPASRTLILQSHPFLCRREQQSARLDVRHRGEIRLQPQRRRGNNLAEGVGTAAPTATACSQPGKHQRKFLSDALKEAYANVFADPGLQKSWISGAATSGTTAHTAESAEERLRKLDNLLKKG